MQLEFGGRRYAVAAADVIIGSAPDSTLLLTAPGVLPRHAVVRPLGDGMAVVVPAAPEAEILVNGTRLGGDPTPLLHGDKIGIGGQEVTVADPRRAGATRVMSAAPALPKAAPFPVTAAPVTGGKQLAGRLVNLRDGREYPISGGLLAIGREAGNAVVVEGDAVSRRHAEIARLGERDWLRDLSGNGTLVNGARVREKTALKSGDLIQVGDVELRYYAPEGGEPARPAAAPVQPAALAEFLVKSGESRGQRLVVRSPVANIGRAAYNDIKLSDASVSASHAKLQLRDGVWVLSDLGSTNGSKVDGEPVNGELPLSPGTTVLLGEVRLFFEPRDGGPGAGAGTAVLRAPVVAQQPDAALVARRVPPRPRKRRWQLVLLGLILAAALSAAGYYYIFLR